MEKVYLRAAVVLFALLALGSNETGLAQQEASKQRVLIGFKDGTGRQAADNRRSWVRNLGGEVHHSFRFLPLVSAGVPENLIARLNAHADIAYVENDVVVHAIQQEIPWGADRIEADLVWHTNTGKGVRVAILDTGIDYDHPDLADNIAGGVNYAGWWWQDGTTNKWYWNDRNGHGSHCAGTVAALDNDIGVVGVAPEASLWAVKVLGDDGSGYVSDTIQGLEWCVENGIDIASMSFGSVEYSQSLENACNVTYGAGVLLIAAAGNEDGGAVIYPAACESVIAVSATNANDEIADFSSSGPEVELAAPGLSITSTYKNGGYAIGDGTSMACPHVAGTAALVWAAEPSLTNQQVRLRLQQTAEDLGAAGRDDLYGHGLVNAAAAVQAPDTHDVAVAAIAAASSVVAGDTATIEVTVQNEGTWGESFDVVLTDDTDGTTISTKPVSLAASASTTVSFSWDTTNASLGGHTLTATAGPVPDETDTTDNSKSTMVAVEAPAVPVTDIAITGVSAPGSVVQGDAASVDVTVENVGNQDIPYDVTVTLYDDTDGAIIDIQTISGGLAAGTSTILTCSWETGDSTSVGEHMLTASHDFADDDAGNDSASTTVTVQEKPAAPMAYVNIDLAKRSFWKWWRVTATVTIADDMVAPIGGATVQGRWNGVYTANVSGITTGNGQVTFWTGWIQTSGTVTLTVDSVVKDSQEYILYGETSDSISH